MSMIYLICGKICSGKSYFAKQLSAEKNAMILSCDEFSRIIDRNIQVDSDKYDMIALELRDHLLRLAMDIAKHGADVILDWGFWTNDQRKTVSALLTENRQEFEWHYMDTSDEQLRKNIEKRNSNLGSADYYVDEGLLRKCLSRFETPDENFKAVRHKS